MAASEQAVTVNDKRHAMTSPDRLGSAGLRSTTSCLPALREEVAWMARRLGEDGSQRSEPSEDAVHGTTSLTFARYLSTRFIAASSESPSGKTR